MIPNPVPSREAVEAYRGSLLGLDAESEIFYGYCCDLLAEVERLTKALSENDTHWARMIVAINATVAAQAAALEEIESWRSDAATSRHWSRGEAVDQLTEILERAALASQRSGPREPRIA